MSADNQQERREYSEEELVRIINLYGSCVRQSWDINSGRDVEILERDYQQIPSGLKDKLEYVKMIEATIQDIRSKQAKRRPKDVWDDMD